MKEIPLKLGIIAGSGVYPRLLAESARSAGVREMFAAAFEGETDPGLNDKVDTLEWMRVGQLNRLVKFFRDREVHHAIMAGQIAPKNLFDFRPDWKALLLLARMKVRNAETIFAAIADELSKNGIELLPATSFLENYLAGANLICGPQLSRHEKEDVSFGWRIAREVARLDIGQTVVVKNGTVLAVEGFDGTNETIKRGGTLAGKGAVVIKVAKPNQDMRFDVPCIGPETVRVAAEAKVRVVAIEANRTLLLDKDQLVQGAISADVSLLGVEAIR
jgi:hypothetical protein